MTKDELIVKYEKLAEQFDAERDIYLIAANDCKVAGLPTLELELLAMADEANYKKFACETVVTVLKD